MSYRNFPSPYCILQYISISWMFLGGYYCSKTGLDDKCSRWYWFAICLLFLFFMLLSGRRFGLQATMIKTQSIFFPITFIAGIVMINYLSHKLPGTKTGAIFAVIGDFSFSIMALHFIGFKMVTYFRTLWDDSIDLSAFPVEQADIYLWMPIYLIVGVVFPILASILFSKLRYAWSCNCRIQESVKNG